MRPWWGRVLCGGIVALGLGAVSRAGDPTVPVRYQDIGKSKLTRLVEVWGAPEQEPALGHVAAFSADGKLAVFAGGNPDAFLSLWDLSKGSMLKEWRIPKASISALALSADGKQVLLALAELGDKGDKGPEKLSLSLRDLPSGKEKRFIGGIKVLPIALAISPDGKHALSGSEDGSVKHWDLDKEIEGIKLAGHKDNATVTSVAFAPNGSLAVSAAQESKIKLWDLKKGKETRELEHAPGAIGLSFSRDGSRMASVSFDHTIKIWDMAAGKEIKTIKRDPPSNGLGTVALSPDGKKVLGVLLGPDPAGVEECTVNLWDATTGKPAWSVKTGFKGLVPIHFEQGLLGGGANPFTRWDLEKGKMMASWGGHKGAVSGLAVTKAGLVFSAGQDGSLLTWRQQPLVGFAKFAEALNAIALSADDKRLVGGGNDNMVRVWEAHEDGKNWTLAHALKGHGDRVTSVAIIPGGAYAVSGSADRTLKIWDVVKGKETDKLVGHADAVHSVAVSPDGKWIASASDDNNVRLWPIKDGKLSGERIVLEGHTKPVMAVAFSPDGKHLLSGSQDKTLKLWDVEEGECIKTLKGHTNWVNVLAFRNNGQAVSAGDDLTIRFWDLQSGKESDSIDLSKSADFARSLAFDRKNSALLVGTAGWVVLRFKLEKE